jgi:hypothetical protein
LKKIVPSAYLGSVRPLLTDGVWFGNSMVTGACDSKSGKAAIMLNSALHVPFSGRLNTIHLKGKARAVNARAYLPQGSTLVYLLLSRAVFT